MLANSGSATISAPSTVTATLAFTVTGAGWNSGDTVNLYWGTPITGTYLSNVVVLSDGSFSTGSPVAPHAYAGAVTISAVDGTTGVGYGTWASATSTMTPLIKATGYGSAYTQGEMLTATGGGFQPNEKVDISVDGASGSMGAILVTATADGEGNVAGANFPLDLASIPANASTVYVVAEGESSQVVASGALPFVATVAASPFLAPASGSVTVSASGVAASATVKIYWNGLTNLLATTTSDSSGNFSQAVTIPSSATKGAYTIYTMVTGGPFYYKTPVSVSGSTAEMADTASTGAAGSTVTVEGASLPASTAVNVTFSSGSTNDATVAATTDGNGNLASTALTVPNVPAGGYTVAIKTTGNVVLVSASYILNYGAGKIGLLSTVGAIGPLDTISLLSANDLAPNESVTLTWVAGSSFTTIGVATTDAYGNLNAPPVGVFQEAYQNGVTAYDVKAYGASSHVSDIIAFSFATFNPSVTLTAGPGTDNTGAAIVAQTPDTIISLTGSGYQPGEYVTATLQAGNGYTTTVVGWTDSTGAFNGPSFGFPPQPGGDTVTVGGLSSLVNASQSMSGELSTYSGHPMDQVTVDATGFGSNQAVNIRWFDDTSAASQTLASVYSNSAGDVNQPVTIPATATNGDLTVIYLATSTVGGVVLPFTVLPPANELCAQQGAMGVGTDPASEHVAVGPHISPDATGSGLYRDWIRPTDIVSPAVYIANTTYIDFWSTQAKANFTTTFNHLETALQSSTINGFVSPCVIVELSMYSPGHSWVGADVSAINDATPGYTSTWTPYLTDYKDFVYAFMDQWQSYYKALPSSSRVQIANIESTNEPNIASDHTGLTNGDGGLNWGTQQTTPGPVQGLLPQMDADIMQLLAQANFWTGLDAYILGPTLADNIFNTLEQWKNAYGGQPKTATQVCPTMYYEGVLQRWYYTGNQHWQYPSDCELRNMLSEDGHSLNWNQYWFGGFGSVVQALDVHIYWNAQGQTTAPDPSVYTEALTSYISDLSGGELSGLPIMVSEYGFELSCGGCNGGGSGIAWVPYDVTQAQDIVDANALLLGNGATATSLWNIDDQGGAFGLESCGVLQTPLDDTSTPDQELEWLADPNADSSTCTPRVDYAAFSTAVTNLQDSTRWLPLTNASTGTACDSAWQAIRPDKTYVIIGWASSAVGGCTSVNYPSFINTMNAYDIDGGPATASVSLGTPRVINLTTAQTPGSSNPLYYMGTCTGSSGCSW